MIIFYLARRVLQQELLLVLKRWTRHKFLARSLLLRCEYVMDAAVNTLQVLIDKNAFRSTGEG